MKEFMFKKYEIQVAEIIGRVEKRLPKIESDFTRSLVHDFRSVIKDLKEKMKLEIAFIGQYSGGKSSIISALTQNKDIKIGQNITTDKAAAYPWNNILLIDTPGIYAGRTEHDEESLKYMDKAHLIVYVITVNGFDDVIGKNFRKHAFGEDKIGKMMLVMNKRSMESSENEENWIKDILQVIEPATPSQLKLSIIDAKDYLDGLDDSDPEIREELVKLSNFSEFLDKLNAFIEENGLIGKLTAPLNVIQTFIGDLINKMTSDSEQVRNTQELLRRKRFIILKSKERLERDTSSRVNNLCSSVIEKGNSIAEKIGADLTDEDSINDEIQKINNEINEILEKTNKEIDKLITEEVFSLSEKLNKLFESKLYENLKRKSFTVDGINVSFEDSRLGEGTKKIPNVLKNIGNFLGKSAVNAEKVGISGLKSVSGSLAHDTVYSIGKFFGKNFEPWGAVKFADKIGKIGKFLGAAQIFAPLVAWQEGHKEEEYAEVIRKTRGEIRDKHFNIKENIKKAFQDKTKGIISGLHQKELANNEKDAESLRSAELSKNENVKFLQKIEGDVKSLIAEIQN